MAWRSMGVRTCVVATLALLACVRDPTRTADPDAATTVDSQSGEQAGEPEPVCGSAAQRFDDYAWIPDDSRLTTSILRDDPELPAALHTLARMADDAGVQLPIRAAIDYRNLSLQLAGLDRVFATMQLDPAELVELHSPAGDVVWLWPSDCPTASLAARVLERFGVLVRLDFEHPGVRVGAGSVERFPFDLVLVHERLLALAPLGRGAAISAWLSKPRADEDGPGVALASLELAAIRSVLSGPSLLTSSDQGSPTTGRHRRIRVTARDWHDQAEQALAPAN